MLLINAQGHRSSILQRQQDFSQDLILINVYETIVDFLTGPHNASIVNEIHRLDRANNKSVAHLRSIPIYKKQYVIVVAISPL